jgi:hypothetical protein
MRVDFPTVQTTARLDVLDVQQYLLDATPFAVQPKARHGEFAQSLATAFNGWCGTLSDS